VQNSNYWKKKTSFPLAHLSILWVGPILEMDWCSWSAWEKTKDWSIRSYWLYHLEKRGFISSETINLCCNLFHRGL